MGCPGFVTGSGFADCSPAWEIARAIWSKGAKYASSTRCKLAQAISQGCLHSGMCLRALLGLHWGYIGVIWMILLGLYWGYIGILLGLCWDCTGASIFSTDDFSPETLS